MLKLAAARDCSKRFSREPIGGILEQFHPRHSGCQWRLPAAPPEHRPGSLGSRPEFQVTLNLVAIAGDYPRRVYRGHGGGQLICPQPEAAHSTQPTNTPQCCGTQPAGRARRGILLTTVTVQSRDFIARLAASGTSCQWHYGLGGWNGPGAQSALSPGPGPVSHGIPCRVVLV